MPGLARITCVTSTRKIDGKTTTASRDCLSAARLPPARFAATVRARWAIGNSRHRVLDVACDKDRARNRNRKDNGPENHARPRKLTLNLARKARPAIPVSRKRERAGWSDDVARSILGQMR